MPLKFDSIRARASKARANWDDLGKAYDNLNEAIPAHTADVKAMAAEVGSMESDLQFAVNTLGNGGPTSEQPSGASTAAVEQPSPRLPTPSSPLPSVTLETSPSPPAVGHSNPNFHEG